MLDFHTHVWEHTPGTPTPTLDQLARYCDAAAARGIEQIAITEHSHRFTRIAEAVMPHWERPRTGPLAEATDHAIAAEQGGDLDAYVAALVDGKERGLPLLVGLEVDHLPGATEAMAAVLADYPFDVLLGSVHWLDDWLFDDYFTPAFAAEWERRDADTVWAQYVDAVIELAASGAVDVLAHVDVVKVAGHRPSDPWRHVQRLVPAIIDAGVAVEVSSGGLHKPCAEIYPAPDLLDALVAAGVPLTTASDAHVPSAVGRSFEVLRGELGARGVTELRTFAARQPRVHRL